MLGQGLKSLYLQNLIPVVGYGPDQLINMGMVDLTLEKKN